MKDIKNNSVKADVSGSISVYKHNRIGQIHIFSKSDFFSQEVVIKIDEEKIIFSHVGIDYVGKSNKFHYRKGQYDSSAMAEIPEGKYEFDKYESNEDSVTIYYR